MTQASTRLPTALIVATVAINSLGIGIVMPVMPSLLAELGLEDIARAAAIGGLLSLAFAGMQVLFAPLVGSLSDRFGRRPVLIASMVMTGVDYAIFASATVLWLFFVARLVSGVTSATFSVANAALADMTPPEKRAAGFGLTGAAFGAGFVLGPVVGGLLGTFGPRAPLIAAAVLCFAAALVIALAMPETLKPENRRRLRARDAIPLASFAGLRRRGALVPLVAASFLDRVSGFVFPAVWAYFAVAQFGWDTTMVGLSLATYGLCMVGVQAGLIRLLLARWGTDRTAMAGLSIGVAGFVVLAGLSSGWLALALIPLFSLREVAGTALNGMMSAQTPADGQGELQGLLTGVQGVASMVSLTVMTQTFAWANAADAARPWPGAPFALAGVFCAMALAVLALRTRAPAETGDGSQVRAAR